MQRWLKDKILLEKTTSQGSARDEVSLSARHPRDPDAGIEPRSPVRADFLLSEPPPRKPIINIENDKYADIS